MIKHITHKEFRELVDKYKGLFHKNNDIAEQFLKDYVGSRDGFDFVVDMKE